MGGIPSTESVTISIHALREEGDRFHLFSVRFSLTISIHALREEGDPLSYMSLAGWDVFLSTPSARRATSKNRDKISIFKQIIQHSARI